MTGDRLLSITVCVIAISIDHQNSLISFILVVVPHQHTLHSPTEALTNQAQE